MKLANAITLSRFVLTVLGLAALYVPGLEWAAFVLFVAAMASDTLDGWIATKFNQRSFFGKIFDQTADKILVNMFWLAFLDLRLLPFWMVAANLFREIATVSIRGVVGEKGVILENEKTGKAEFTGRLKAGVQMFVILVGLLLMTIYGRVLPLQYAEALYWLALISVTISYLALIDFLWKSRGVLTKDM